MKLNRLSLAVSTCLLAGAGVAHADNGLRAKQLAGPPSEFAMMAPANPADAAIHSKSALLPVSLGADKKGGFSWAGELPVESENTRFLVFSGDAPDWSVKLRDPRGVEKSAQSVVSEIQSTTFGMGNANYPVELFALKGVQPGDWSVKLEAASGARRDGVVLIEGDSATQLVSYKVAGRQLVGDSIGVVASLYGFDGESVQVGKSAGSARAVSLVVTGPDGARFEVAMHDDGKHQDGKAGDGIYGGVFVAESEGLYQAQVQFRGSNAKGLSIIRTAEHVIPVLEPSIRLSGTKATAVASGGERLSLKVPVAADKTDRHYRGYAEVWGTSADGRSIPVAWVGGMVQPAQGSLDLGLDTRWVAMAGARAPFELRNLRIEDPDYFVTMAESSRLPMASGDFQVKAAAEPIAVDEMMLMGPRPADLLSSEKATGSRLLLVHGYCSGGVWPASQFSNASTFLDVNQNRTHDQFAQRIRSFGSSWNSFGVVAHSQGGAASLHLYTYYWSGLDNASGSRLIQSVGTPYQGTNLAGILAALGNWFGVGCGTNNNLTYSGASAWLAGIPSWARSKVNYYTTSFETAWWRYDYCNMATDVVLSDPEDGTTEQAKGQVSGAINRGHATGQCHTAGMRDPAQYLNASRNSTMNSNAAR